MNRATVMSVCHSRIYLRVFRNRISQDLDQAVNLLGFTWYVFSAAANVSARLSSFEQCEFYLDAATRLASESEELNYCSSRLLQFRNSPIEFIARLNRNFVGQGLRPFVTLIEQTSDSPRNWRIAPNFEAIRKEI